MRRRAAGSPRVEAPSRQELAERAAERIIRAKSEFLQRAFAALSFNGISGDYAEFGCFGGLTMWLAHTHVGANPVPRHLWAFDSFRGLPESDEPRDAHPAWIAGTMSMDVDRFHAALAERGVPRSEYTVVEGFFEDSLPPLGSEGPPRDIALAYVDCDLYSSTVDVLRFLEPRLKHGMIVVFDDYYCWSATDVSGERAALHEFTAAHPEWNFHRYQTIHWDGLAFVVEDANLLRSRGR